MFTKKRETIQIASDNNVKLMKRLGGLSMRIESQGKSIDTVNTSVSTNAMNVQGNIMPDFSTGNVSEPKIETTKTTIFEEQELSKEKLKKAIDVVNEFLQINHNASKFVLHDGLDRYFVQVVDTQTEEVVKEIPPKKLLDAYYEMQKLLGMIVDEKI